ncbi:hypothetical protein PAXRUDRAFT_824173 [Paxillus rubicundulus Ve08.2h10]|uniref:Unplaced genomic scaffold scaffold_82, whole genome shotgun sequence n=1 Tax=Paxillus rubicundulus Ve08.2h10 TaxID=930991 RepID=A0A0D0DUP8_9AGAM|nr:hypothetical protein PAXRUDRAFT_824173 [Paxillus rubicundulus Ve08.2h10]
MTPSLHRSQIRLLSRESPGRGQAGNLWAPSISADGNTCPILCYMSCCSWVQYTISKAI